MQTFNLPARTLATGDTGFGPFAVPVGTSKVEMSLDITQMVLGQRVWVHVEFFDGVNWFGSKADFIGINPATGLPYINKFTGLPFTTATLDFSMGQGRVSAAGWQARVTFTVENGPYDTAGGTLTLT